MSSRSQRRPQRRIAAFVAALLALAALLPTGPSARAASEGAAAVILSNQAQITSISLGELRRCFLGSAVVVSGIRLIPFNHPPGSAMRTLFDREVLGMTLMASQRYWIDSRIRGGPRAPRTVSDPKLLGKVVARLPGAISYMDAASATRAPGLHTVAIDGVAADDPRYPLR